MLGSRPPHAPDSLSSSNPSSSSAATSADTTLGDGTKDLSGDCQPVKRGRRSNPKVKTGCSNCKQRRIKCDELRPACTQCIRSKKVCTGYPPPSRSSQPLASIMIAPKPALAVRPQAVTGATPSGIIKKPVILPPRRANRRKSQPLTAEKILLATTIPTLYHPSSNLGFQQIEGLYFELFRIETASELSGYFNSTFWAQRVLQECHSEPAIRHSVVALGALYKTLEQTSHLGSISREKREAHMNKLMSHWQVAIKQYSEACKSILLVTGDGLRSYRTRLMASILLACFDSFIGDHKQGIIQIQNGLGLLEQLQAQYPNHRYPSPEGYIEDDLIIIFTRLAIQAKSYDMAFHFPQPYVIRLAPQAQRSEDSSPVSSDIGSPGSPSDFIVPPRFDCLLDARLASDKLCEKLLKFIERLQVAKSNRSNVLPASWKQYGMNLKGELDAWAKAFEYIFQSRFDPRVSHIEKSGIAALKMFQINANIIFLMMFCDTEVQFDAFIPHFRGIVDLGWEVVGAEENRAAARLEPKNGIQHQHTNTKGAFKAGKFTTSHIKPSFSADLGIVPPLFVVATKCREPRLRRQAIQLLRHSSRREGMWDSELAANIGQWVMQIEETDQNADFHLGGTTVPASPIAEERRVMVKSVDFDLRSRFADIRVGTRAVHEGQADDRIKTTRIRW